METVLVATTSPVTVSVTLQVADPRQEGVVLLAVAENTVVAFVGVTALIVLPVVVVTDQL
jgi:hypothetical protein